MTSDTLRLPAPGSLGAWVLAARPKTLPVGVAPVLLGMAVAYAAGAFSAGPALAALVGSVLIQIGTNFANDLFDFRKGADTAARIGPVRAAAAGLLTPAQVRNGTVAAFGLATLVGLYLVYVGGWPIVAIGIASILCGVAYTGGPYPLGWNGLGDLFVFVFFGPVAVAGTVWVQLHGLPNAGGTSLLVKLAALPSAVWLASLPVGALATAVLIVNNVRDLPTDAAVGKRTLAVRFGRRFGVVEYGAMLGLAAGAPVALWSAAFIPGAWFDSSGFLLLPLLTIPWGVMLLRTLARSTDGPTLNETLASTAKLGVVHAALFAIGIAVQAR
jgi:1,4-dihydroxy-2-naphthoate octaprenyltransferase